MTCVNVASNFCKSGKATKWYLDPYLEASVMKRKPPTNFENISFGHF